MPDMLVNLYGLEDFSLPEILVSQGIEIRRALSPDKIRILDYVRTHFEIPWVSECDVAFSHAPVTCFIAVKDKKIIGFSCYDTTAKGYFGPTGVTENCRGAGVGKALLLRTLEALKESGYGYAIIGWVGEAEKFYKKAVQAQVIENSSPGIYQRMINTEE